MRGTVQVNIVYHKYVVMRFHIVVWSDCGSEQTRLVAPVAVNGHGDFTGVLLNQVIHEESYLLALVLKQVLRQWDTTCHTWMVL